MRIDAGTRALVTGASRGIGAALARALAARGATVGLAARSESELAGLARDLPGEHHVFETDVGDGASVQAAVDAMRDRAGGLDLVIANAGVADYGPFEAVGVDAIERMTRVNWLGTVHTVGAALPHLLDRAEGHIVIVSSAAAGRAFPWAAGYGATKAAQRMFGEALWHELSGTGVGLTVVHPGEIRTDLHAHEHRGMPDWYRGGAAAASADDLAAATLKAVESGRRSLWYPPITRLLPLAHGISPRVADVMLRVLRGSTAAPRRG